MNPVLRFGATRALALTLAATACGGNSANGPAGVTAQGKRSIVDDHAATLRLMDHEGDHQGAVTLLIAMSLETLGLSPEQHAAVEKIRTDLYARMEPTRAAEHNLVATLAEGVAVSSLEATKLDAAVAQVTMAAAAVQDASADAMDALHGVLTPVQRASLVDAVESQWAMWQRTNADGTGPMYPNDGHLAMLAMGLDLTAEQVDTIRASLGEASVAVPELDPKEVATHVRAFGVAFRSEKLEARGFITARSKNARVAALGAEHMTHFVEAVSPVLTPDQRAAFAQKLREHAAREPNTRRTSRTALREAPTDRTVGGRP